MKQNIFGTPKPRKSRIDPNLAEKLNKYYANQPDEAVEQAEKKKTIQPITTKADITKSDFIQIPNTDVLISKFELPEFNNLNYVETHKKLLKQGLFMSTPALFMPYFINVSDANQGKIKLYDGLGNPLKQEEVKDIYRHLTENHIAAYENEQEGVWTWLNAQFKKQGQDWIIKTIKGLDKKDNLVEDKNKLEDCIREDCYVDLKFNNQGLPTKKSKKQDYSQGQNIYFWHPRDEAVAWFFALSGGSYLGCVGILVMLVLRLGCLDAAKQRTLIYQVLILVLLKENMRNKLKI